MKLSDLIEELKKFPLDTKVKWGNSTSHLYDLEHLGQITYYHSKQKLLEINTEM